MELRNYTLDIMVDQIKNKNTLSKLERDILKSIEELYKFPVNRESLVNRITENRLHNLDIWLVRAAQLGNGARPFSQLTDEELRNNLLTQIQQMWIKEIEQQSHM